jgi:hypothetical protein
MIFSGKVTVSMDVKDKHEYFQLYRSNYLGDYQILLDLKSSECYKSTSDVTTYCYCISQQELMELMLTFPDAKTVFLFKAQARRIEFRRIKKLYEIEASVHPDPQQDEKDV